MTTDNKNTDKSPQQQPTAPSAPATPNIDLSNPVQKGNEPKPRK